jgi:hypothetical protein
VWPQAKDGAVFPDHCATVDVNRRPSCESDESFAEVIQVLDPRHPLYRRFFRVIRRRPIMVVIFHRYMKSSI